MIWSKFRSRNLLWNTGNNRRWLSDYPGNFPSQNPSIVFCSKVRPGNPSMSASDPLQGAHGTGCPVFGLGLVTLESLTTAEHWWSWRTGESRCQKLLGKKPQIAWHHSGSRPFQSFQIPRRRPLRSFPWCTLWVWRAPWFWSPGPHGCVPWSWLRTPSALLLVWMRMPWCNCRSLPK